MRRIWVTAALAAVVVLAAATSLAGAGGDKRGGVEVKLSGYQEVPSISSDGRGSFAARIGFAQDTIEYRLSYRGLEGGAVVGAHIHIGDDHENGGIVAFLCGGGPTMKPACPARGTVTGTITAADVVAVPAQGIAAGELDEVIRAIRAGEAYANVHTEQFRGGEIRGDFQARHKFKFGGFFGADHDDHEDDHDEEDD